MKYLLFKKIAFFWVIFHSIAFLSFKLPFTPSISENRNGVATINYILTPSYEVRYPKHNRLFELRGCYKCNEEDNFYPFHKFKYSISQYNKLSSYFRGTDKKTEGFVGIFGYYGNQEFIAYVVVPLGIWLLVLLYRKLFNTH